MKSSVNLKSSVSSVGFQRLLNSYGDDVEERSILNLKNSKLNELSSKNDKYALKTDRTRNLGMSRKIKT